MTHRSLSSRNPMVDNKTSNNFFIDRHDSLFFFSKVDLHGRLVVYKNAKEVSIFSSFTDIIYLAVCRV